ncbi:endonuclease/exonuclease/phosphatase family protein [Gillisia mitskevichiae]|uniref:Endonuclease/exonuclease/phosphatase family protein n=1 Tax=Gillisia mitskevichiae TaxID=270921 RepID=A0A495PT35_9FLAO|nr:endonuclease/exonuclease/phosphatase family protein [Gillisia mitskevichiae]RKS53774.1 endonuclease/exonuclease/phosphatase family protein [Gillisia mitskevichiae]
MLKPYILLFLFLFLFSELVVAQVKISSWNLQNFGKTKSESEINFVADVLNEFDVVALQEIVAGYGGVQAVAKLADALNRKGSKWGYVISEPTQSTPYATERYAYLWKTSKVKQKGKGWLEPHYRDEIDREPYMLDFIYNGQPFTLVNFHAIPKKKQPETEIKYFKFLPGKYPDKNLIFLGDFNVPQSHTVFNPLKKIGYLPLLENQKTTMKMECVGEECLASEYDNIFFNSKKINLLNFGVVLIYKSFPNMQAVRRISDHIPVWAEFEFSSKRR